MTYRTQAEWAAIEREIRDLQIEYNDAFIHYKEAARYGPIAQASALRKWRALGRRWMAARAKRHTHGG